MFQTNFYNYESMNDNINRVTYEYLADEYYNKFLHPTCFNFRSASKLLIELFITKNPNITNLKTILELGAGRSVVAETLLELKINAELTISDSERKMLNHSEIYKDKWKLKVIDAEQTELPNNSFDLIVSSLGDPYNTKSFWNEISRLLRSNGVCLFTTPSFEWCSGFRTNKDTINLAEFTTGQKGKVYLPSFIYDKKRQKALVEKNKRLIVESVEDIRLSRIANEKISPKLLSSKGDELAIVTSYIIRKSENN